MHKQPEFDFLKTVSHEDIQKVAMKLPTKSRLLDLWPSFFG